MLNFGRNIQQHPYFTTASVLGVAMISKYIYDYFSVAPPDYKKDFIASGSNFNRGLTLEEKSSLSAFPNLKKDSVTFLGAGVIKPTEDNCKYYQCYFPHTIIMFDKKGIYKNTITSVSSDIDIAQLIWEKCNSLDYNCQYKGAVHFGATYNCIGWALGITKWLDPREITAHIKSGKTKGGAIDQFIKDKSLIYNETHVSNIGKIVDKLHSIPHAPSKPIDDNTVAFFFDSKDQCQHGARYIEILDNKPLNKFTSKLGGYITISHDEDDLLGASSPYGENLHYAET